MQTETVVRVRGLDELTLQTLAPAEPWSVGQAGQDSRDTVLNGWRLFLGQTADVVPGDKVRVRGIAYSVVGKPADWLGGGLVVEVADIWTATCTIRHPGGTRGAFNTATGSYATTPFDPHYTGDCWVEVLPLADQQLVAADESVTQVKYLVVVDLAGSETTQVGDLVELATVDANGDPLLVGRALQVQAFARGAMAWQRNLLCSDLLPPKSID